MESFDLDLKTLKLPYWDRINFFDTLGLDLKSTWTNLLDLDSFYDKLYFGLGLVDLINQAGMLLQKYEDFLSYLLRS